VITTIPNIHNTGGFLIIVQGAKREMCQECRNCSTRIPFSSKWLQSFGSNFCKSSELFSVDSPGAACPKLLVGHTCSELYSQMNLRGREQKPFADHSNGMIFIDIQCWLVVFRHPYEK
jgi:hypothetical protein